MQALLVVGGYALAISALLGLAGIAWRKLGRPLLEFLADWRGELPRPGYEGRPGVPERLTAVETGQRALREDVAGLGQQLGAMMPTSNGAPQQARREERR